MGNILKGDAGKFIMAGLAVVVGLVVFQLFVEKSEWYQKQKSKK